MEKKKSFQMPHTYIIIFFVIVLAAVLTLFIPLGQYETKEITYMQNGSEKTRTVLDPDSFRYVLDENGNKVTKAAPIFGTEDFGGQGILNFGDREDGGAGNTSDPHPYYVVFIGRRCFRNGRRGDSLCHDSCPAFYCAGL